MNVIAIIPAYNESQTITEVIYGLRLHVSEIIVIDDGSHDRTAELARNAGATVLQHATNRGLGAALSTGIAAALSRGADIIVTFDADGQMNPTDVPRLTTALVEVGPRPSPPEVSPRSTYSIAIGSRWLKNRHPITRWLYNFIANLFTYFFSSIWSTDTQSGLRAITADAARKLELKSQRMEVSSEFFFEIARLGLRFVEIPIEPRYTDYSRSKGQNFFVGLATLGRLFLRRLTR
jgi:glycosyltransferase involved in cell wall biosynthesis